MLLIVASALALSRVQHAASRQRRRRSRRRAPTLGINLAWMDKSVVPGDDFFSYANGTWVKNTPKSRPTARASAASTSPTRSARRTRRELFDASSSPTRRSGNDALIANYYNAYLDTDAIDRAGLAPAKADLDAIARDRRQARS